MDDAEEEDDMSLSIADYLKYPFLRDAREFMKKMPISTTPLGEMLTSPDGKTILELSKLRIMTALGRPTPSPPKARNEIKLASFYVARMILTCSKSPKNLVEKLIECESGRCIEYIKTEGSKKRDIILKELGIDIGARTMLVLEYLPLTLRLALKDPRWKLINRRVAKGKILLPKGPEGYKELTEVILKEKIKDLMRVGLYMPGEETLAPPPKDALRVLGPIADEILVDYYKAMSEDIGEVTPSNYPPCMTDVINMMAQGDNPTHPARFALVAFANAIGLGEEEILELFKHVRDFNPEFATYQIRHITGKLGGTEYKTPACAKLRSYGLCKAGDNKLCAKVAHPLGYYAARQKWKKKEQAQKA